MNDVVQLNALEHLSDGDLYNRIAVVMTEGQSDILWQEVERRDKSGIIQIGIQDE